MVARRIEIEITGSAKRFVTAMEEMEDKAHEETDEVAARFDDMGKRVGRVFEAIAARGEEMGIVGSGALGTFGQHLEDTDKKAKGLGSSVVSLGNKMMLGVGAGLAYVAYESVKSVMTLQTSQSALRAALAASHQSWERNQKAIQASKDAEMALGFTDDETLSALAQGVVATGSLAKARRELALASDLARYKNIDLASAELMINQAEAGNLRGIKSLGINLNVVAGGATNVAKAKLAVAAAERNLQMVHQDQGATAEQSAEKTKLAYQKAAEAIALSQEKANERISASRAKLELEISTANAKAALRTQQAEAKYADAAPPYRSRAMQEAIAKARQDQALTEAEGQQKLALFQSTSASSLALGDTADRQKMALLSASMVNNIGSETKAHNTLLVAVERVAFAKRKLYETDQSGKEIMTALTEKLREQAQLYAQTLPGKIDIFKAHVKRLEDSIGGFLIPKLSDVAGFATKMISNPVLLGASAAVIGIPIIAALGAFAEKHIISPLIKLGSFIKDVATGHPLQALKNLFTGKGGLSGSAAALDDSAKALSAAAEKLSGAAGAEDTAAGELDASSADLDASAARGGGGLGGGMGALAAIPLAGYAGYQLSEYLAKNKDVQAFHNQLYSMFGGQLPGTLGQVPFGLGAQIALQLSKEGFNVTLSTPLIDLFKDKLDKAPHHAAQGLKAGSEEFRHFFSVSESQQRTVIDRISKVLEGRSRDPQVVRILDDNRLGTYIGTSAGVLLGRSLDANLYRSASKQESANKALKDATERLNTAVKALEAWAKVPLKVAVSVKEQSNHIRPRTMHSAH